MMRWQGINLFDHIDIVRAASASPLSGKALRQPPNLRAHIHGALVS